MAKIFNRGLYKDYVEVLEGMGVYIPDYLEDVYKQYICEQMKDMPYADPAITKMYTVVFFLKYIKQMEGKIKFKDVYSKLEVQKRLIGRAMANIDISFGTSKEAANAGEDWSSLYSIKLGIGAGLQGFPSRAKPVKPKTA